MMQARKLATLALFSFLGACATPPALLLDGMGAHTRRVGTEDALAQRYFDQGLNLCYGFNHDEALRSFREAATLDPDCAMAYWGEAYALSPNINLPLPEENAVLAHAAIQQAVARKGQASPVHRDLIDALATRFAVPVPTERKHLDEAYAKAMAGLWKKYPDDDDIGFLYADALMNLAPWNQWTSDFEPQPNTTDILSTLERVMELNVNHPGANHFYIHAMEASAAIRQRPRPPRIGSASLVPGIGHLVHMPAHIYIQVGRFEDSMDVQPQRPRSLDREYFAADRGAGDLPLLSRTQQSLPGLVGDVPRSLRGCAWRVVRLTLQRFAGCRSTPIPGAAEWLVMDLHVHIRFGNWEAVLSAESPRADQPYAVAMWRYARGMAFANTKRIAEAKAEAVAFEEVVAMVPEEQLVFIVPAHNVLNVAREMLAGETRFHSGDYEVAFAHLRAAVAAEDALHYSEPSPWMMPTRHALGALLLQRGEIAAAEAHYRHDLKRHPGNGWSLHGLAECLDRRDATAEAASMRKRFDKAWSMATVKIKASCFCRSED